MRRRGGGGSAGTGRAQRWLLHRPGRMGASMRVPEREAKMILRRLIMAAATVAAGTILSKLVAKATQWNSPETRDADGVTGDDTGCRHAIIISYVE